MLAEEAEFLTAFDRHLFNEGTHFRIYEKFGAHLTQIEGVAGAHFAVWAPNALRVSVMGDFNGWNPDSHLLSLSSGSGIWAGFIPGVNHGDAYRYHVTSSRQGYRAEKIDPVGFVHELVDRHVSLVWDLSYEWQDHGWLARRAGGRHLDAPMAIYEVHLGSWMRVPEEGNRPLTYREIAPKLAEYARDLGFSHVELLPVMEHPMEGMRNYQTLGYFAPASRYGTPQDLMYLIDQLHQQNLGVILDWVPGHFPAIEEGLEYFDGTQLYEHGFCELTLNENAAECSFDFQRREVLSFLFSSAFFWLEQYHADGLRVDTLGPILYLDFGRRPGDWAPNPHGGRENLEGIAFLRQLNSEVEHHFPEAQMIAGEASDWPLVSHPAHGGGLGFTQKWEPEFPRRALEYFAHDPFFRKFHHASLSSHGLHSFNEHPVLPLSHEQAERSQPSLLSRMPGDDWQRFANLRLMLGYFYLQPGKKLVFMGDEFGQWQPWNPEASLDWHLCQMPAHRGLQLWVGDLNRVYRAEMALHLGDEVAAGFEWVDAQDAERSTLSWLRRDPQRREVILAVCNFKPLVYRNFRLGVRRGGHWREILNSDARDYGGSGQGNFGGVTTAPFSSHGLPHTLTITLPPLAIVVFKYEGPSYG